MLRATRYHKPDTDTSEIERKLAEAEINRDLYDNGIFPTTIDGILFDTLTQKFVSSEDALTVARERSETRKKSQVSTGAGATALASYQ
jgi:hypothetical protein